MAEINNTGRELGWDDIIEHDSTFVVLPEGDYPFVVTGFERGRFNGSEKLSACSMAIVTLDVSDPISGQTATVTENLPLHTKMEWKLCQFFTCLGLRKHGERLQMPWNRVIGAHGWCRLNINRWTGQRDGREMENNRVDKFLAPDEAPATSPAQPAAPVQAPAPAWKAGTF